MTDHEPLIELSDLAVGYDGEVALRNLDLAVHQGDLIGIVGPSGCGKTSLLRALMGDIETYAGSTSKLQAERRRARPHRLRAAGRDGRLELPDHGRGGRAVGRLA